MELELEFDQADLELLPGEEGLAAAWRSCTDMRSCACTCTTMEQLR